MKKLCAILCALINASIICSAQETRIIEPAVIEINYRVRHNTDNDLYALRCGKTVSQYFSLAKLRNDSLQSSPDIAIATIPLYESMEAIKHRDDPSKKLPTSPGHGDYLYWNMSAGRVSVYTSVFGSNYLVEEEIPAMDWEVEEDSVQTIIGYECHKAVTKFRGREWTVWYAEDIPVSLGPWKFSGLPGLILQAECKGYMTITAQRLATTGLSPVTFYNFGGFKYESLERKKYWKAKTNPSSYPPNTRMTPPMELE